MKSLPYIVRAQFLKDIQTTIGDIETALFPLSLKPVLKQLLTQAQDFVEKGNEAEFIDAFAQVVALCAKGWSHLSYWICTEQSLCYSLFWGLKAALENYQQLAELFNEAKNDGPAQNDTSMINSHLKITLIKDWLNEHLP
jgi:hypothetical protein